MAFICKLLTVNAHCACALTHGRVMTADGTADLNLAKWLRRDRRSHPRIYE